MATKQAYGYVNCCHYNTAAEGDEHWYLTREERDAAMLKRRERAIADGLAPSAARAGIYPIKGPLTESVEVAIRAWLA